MPNEFDHDVFISYSSKDRTWVRGELLERIEQTGLRAFIDFRDFTRGAPSIKEMERGVLTSCKTLLILTPNYIESEWAEIESIMAQSLSPANRDLRLIPLLKADCKKPLRIGALTHIDFREGEDQDLAWLQLLTALGKPPELEQLTEPLRDQWFLAHPYPMPPNFTGRITERAMLDRWLEADLTHPLLSLRALGGFGKSALVWHWLTHDVQPASWPRVAWWSFYESGASFDQFLGDTLAYLSGNVTNVAKLSGKDALRALQQKLHASNTLLVLDGFERMLRAFDGLDATYQGDDVQHDESDRDCTSPLAEQFLRHVALQPQLRSKVLLTTRLSPRVLDAKGGGLIAGCHEVQLDQMQPADTVEFFHAQGIRGTHTEIEAASAPYGYHPLSLRLLAGLVMGDFQQPGDIAVAKRLDVSGNLVQRQHHVLQMAYDSLAPSRQILLSRIACFRGSVGYDTLNAIEVEKTKGGQSTSSTSLSPLDTDLRNLIARGLLQRDARTRRFDLHPIVRRYAYDRLTAPDRAAAHIRLRDYFAAAPKPDNVTRLEDLASVIELFHHTARAGQLDEAATLLYNHIGHALYFQLGAYQLTIDLLRQLFRDGEDHLPCLKDNSSQGWALGMLANAYGLNGQPRRALPLFKQLNVIGETLDNKRNLVVGLGAVASVALHPIGELRSAEANYRRCIALCKHGSHPEYERQEAIGHRNLGRLLADRGAYAASERELTTALKIFTKYKDFQAQGIVWAYRAQRELLRLRNTTPSKLANPESAAQSARRALELADETTRRGSPVERDYIRAHWLSGAARRVAGQSDKAEHHLHEALTRCRRTNLVDHEANILIDLARLRVATGALDEAHRLLDEALLITERSSYVLQGADAHLELAKLAVARDEPATALEHARKAKDLATCDGPPDYTYKAAYGEATALLTRLA